jgi:hypothetical protein
MAYLGRPASAEVSVTGSTDTFTGDGGTTFTLSRQVKDNNPSLLEVFVSNVQQQPSVTFSVASTTLTFTTAPSVGEPIYVTYRDYNAAPFFTVPDGAITAAKLANDSVTNAKIGSIAVTEGKIANESVTEAKIGSAAVTEAKIASGAVVEGKLAANAVTTSKISSNVSIQFAAGSNTDPSISTIGDTNTGIFFPAADTIAFAEGGAEAMRIDSSGNVGIGTTSPVVRLNVTDSADGGNSGTIRLGSDATYYAQHQFRYNSSEYRFGTYGAGQFMSLYTAGTERARITSGGDLLVNKTAANTSTVGFQFIVADNKLAVGASDNPSALFNRNTNDGQIVQLAQDGTVEGTISVSGTAVSYNGGNLSRWAQMLTKPDLLKGTVMSNLDEMNEYVKPTLYWTEDDELPVDEEGNPTVAVGDVKQETSVSENEQLNKVKVSDVEGDANVAGVFVNWDYDEAHQVDEINMAMTGDMIIRIAQGVTVARGDLLMSAGDGTAKPQGDDIVRSKTIAKVTSTHVTCTYEDGSYCVPCVLMAC